MTAQDIQALNQCAVGESVTLSDGMVIARDEDGDCQTCPFTDQCAPGTRIGNACGYTSAYFEEVPNAD